MNENYIEIECPNCNKKLIIDIEKKIVLKISEGDKKKLDLEEFFTKEKNKGKVLEEKFSSSLSFEKNKKDLLEAKFKTIIKNVKDVE